MRSDFSGPGQPLLLVSLTCLMALVFEGSSAQRIPEGTLVRRGAMSPKDRPRVESFTVDSQVAGWEIVLVTRDPRLIDLDLFVYTSWSEGRRSRLCASEGIESIETCRIGRVPSGQFMVEIVASEGRDRSEYTLTIRPLRGAGIVGTHLVTEDATPLRTGAWTRAVLSGVAPQQYSSIAAWGLYEVRADALVDSRDWIFAATSADPSAPIVMMIFDSGGNEVSRSQATLQEPSQYQDVRVAGPVTDRLYALVASTGRASPTVQIGAFRANSPIPLPGGFDDAKKKTDQWFASGTEGRAYALQLDEGSTGIVALEGIGVQLLVADPSGGALPVKRSFGSAQQLAWIGRPLGQSTHVLTGLTTSRTIIAGVE